MGYVEEDGCVGPCPMGCIHCSKGGLHRFYYCDDCGHDFEEGEKIYLKEGKELCFKCYKESFMSKILDDMDDEVCSECGEEAEELFLEDGRWVCETCLKENAEILETDTDYRDWE